MRRLALAMLFVLASFAWTTAHSETSIPSGKWTGAIIISAQTSYNSPSILDIVVSGNEVNGVLYSDWHKESFPLWRGKFSGGRLEFEANSGPFTRRFSLTYNDKDGTLQGEVVIESMRGPVFGTARFKRP